LSSLSTLLEAAITITVPWCGAFAVTRAIRGKVRTHRGG
jgi:hypothetical protein